jgi:hypothetical protein
VYPVTLVVDDGRELATRTQHLTVRGAPVEEPAFVLSAPDEVAFRPRPQPVADVYGWPVRHAPHTQYFTAAPGGGPTPARIVTPRNIGGGELPACEAPHVKYLGAAKDWLQATKAESRSDSGQEIRLVANPGGLSPSRYFAVVTVNCPGALNPVQGFRVELSVRPAPESDEVIVDDRDEGFYATPYFWVGHQFLRCPQRGYGRRYLTSGGRAAAGEFVRFTPTLAAGKYEVLLHDETPTPGKSQFPVRVRHAGGVKEFMFSPQQAASRSLGVYEFAAGDHGYVEFHAGDSTGLVVADALVFRRVTGER